MCTGSCDEKPRAARQGGPLKAALAAALALLMTGSAARAADSFSTDWAQGAKSQARLIAAGGGLAGFEIALAPGAITYWRDPGDSGLPPTLDFSGSENVAGVEALFPAPKRIKEADGGEAFGYDGAVIFPLRVKPRDPAKPVRLALNADFAVCEKVCLPAKARLSLTLPAAGGFALRGRDRRISALAKTGEPIEFRRLPALAPSALPRRLRHGGERRLVVGPGEDVLGHAFRHRLTGLDRRRADMGQQHRVGKRDQLGGNVGLVLVDVEAGGQDLAGPAAPRSAPSRRPASRGRY